MKISPTSPRKKVISSEEIGANAFAQADMAVKEREASIVVTTPKKISKFNLSFRIYHTFILLSSSIVKILQK